MSAKRLIAAIAGVGLVLAATTALVQMNPTGSRAGTTSSTRVVAKSTVLYLDIGASVSVGVQPTPQNPKGQPTNRGYSNRLVALEAAKGITLKLEELGCPGESIASMIHGPDPCYVAPDTQLSDAVVLLRNHHNAVTLVTVDLGFNTLNVCLRNRDIDLTCVAPQLKLLRNQLAQVMRVLTSAAGPHVTFIGVGHYNPYLSLKTKEGSTEIFAAHSVTAIHNMNTSLADVYGSFNIPLADVAAAFHEEDLRVVHIPNKEATTVNVQYECKLTWMCAPKPYGPNIHPSDAGYVAIAKAIVAVLPTKL